MKKRLLLPIAGLFACTVLFAQDTDTENDEVFELSPFVVDAADSDGYLATNTLAGTRLKTDLDEVGSALSIITQEFMQDTGATDAESLLFYTTNAEVGGSQGNWAGGIVSGRVNQTSARTSPQYNQRIRGLTAAELTRDYFRSSIPFDGYNTTRVTLNRGPNAILFGIGSAGGVVNNTTKQALLNETSASFTFRLGDEGSHREVFDYNHPVIQDRLSARISLMNENQQYRQNPAFENDQRAFLALTGILQEGRANSFLGKTIVRANFEVADIEANPVNPIPPNDSFSDWFSLPIIGREAEFAELGISFPGWRWNNYTPKWTQWGDQGGWGRTVLGYPYFRQLGLFYTPENGGEVGYGSGLPWDGGQGTVTNGPGYNGHFQSTRPLFAETQFIGFTVPVIQDRDIFDYENHLFTGDLNRRWMDYNVKNIRIEQLFWDGKAGIELAWNDESYSNKAFLPFSGGEGTRLGFQDVFVDINKSLPNSTNNNEGVVLNPNVGRPMVRQIGMLTNFNESDWEAYRITAYTQLDARDYLGDTLGWWLGNHTFNVNYSDETNDTHYRTEGLTWDGNFPDGSPYTSGYAWSADNAGVASWARLVVGLAYIGDDMRDLDDPSQLRLSPIQANLPKEGDVYNMFYKDKYTNTIKEGNFKVGRYVMYTPSLQEISIESLAGSLHSKFLDEHLITLVGYRYDKQIVRQEFDYDNDDDDTTWNHYYDEESDTYTGGFNMEQLRLGEPQPPESDHSLSYSVVGRFPERLLFDLPFNSDLNIFYNYSDSFDPSGRRIGVLGNEMDLPKGETKEYGFMLDMFEKKLSIRANWYETKEQGRTYPGGVGGAVQWSLQNISNWIQRMSQAQFEGERPFYTPNEPIDPETGPEDALRRMYTRYEQGNFTGNINLPANPNVFINGDGESVTVNSYEQMYELIASLIPEPVRSRYNPRYDPQAGGVVTTDFGNRVATVDTVAEGFEFDITGNPIRGLRMTANVGFQETTLNDVAPVLTGLVDDIVANIERSGMRDLRDTPNGEEGSSYYGRYENRVLSPLFAEKTKEGQVSQEQRKWRVNFVTNYSFTRDSWLRGFGIGGAVRWQSENATGYSQARNDDGIIVPLLDQAFEDDAIWSGDFWVSYQKKLSSGVDWRIQLNIGNAFGDDDPIVTTRNPDGSVAVIRFSPPTRVFLTNTFRW